MASKAEVTPGPVEATIPEGAVALYVQHDVALALTGVIEALRDDRRFFQKCLGVCGGFQSNPRSGPLTDLILALAGKGGLSVAESTMQRLGRVANGS